MTRLFLLVTVVLYASALHAQERTFSAPARDHNSAVVAHADTTVTLLTSAGGALVSLKSRTLEGGTGSALPFQATRTIESEVSVMVKAPRQRVYNLVADVGNKDGFFTYGRARTVLPDPMKVLPKNQILTLTLLDEARLARPANAPARTEVPHAIAPPHTIDQTVSPDPRKSPDSPMLKTAIAKFEFTSPTTITETLVTDPLGDCLTCDRKKGRIIYTFEDTPEGTRFTGKATFEVEGDAWTKERVEKGWQEFVNNLEKLAIRRK